MGLNSILNLDSFRVWNRVQLILSVHWIHCILIISQERQDQSEQFTHNIHLFTCVELYSVDSLESVVDSHIWIFRNDCPNGYKYMLDLRAWKEHNFTDISISLGGDWPDGPWEHAEWAGNSKSYSIHIEWCWVVFYSA